MTFNFGQQKQQTNTKNMNTKHAGQAGGESLNYQTLYHSKYCDAVDNEIIYFYPSGIDSAKTYEIHVDPDHSGNLEQQIQEYIDDANASSAPVSAFAIHGLVEFDAFLCDPSQQARIERDIRNSDYFELPPGKSCKMTADGGMEICAGRNYHKVGAEELSSPGSALGYLLETLRHKPWFTDEIRLELCETLAVGWMMDELGR